MFVENRLLSRTFGITIICVVSKFSNKAHVCQGFVVNVLAIFAKLNTREIFLNAKFAKINTHEIFLQLKFAKKAKFIR